MTEQPQFYNPSTAIAGVVRTLMPWQQSFLEASPLSRPLEKGGAGVDWQPGVHTNRISYTLNDNTSFNSSSNAGSRKVALYTVGINTDGSRSLIRQNNTATYNDNELQVVISRNENWTSNQGCSGTTEEYTDPEGNVVLKRSYNYNGSQYEMLSTYYVYDDFGMLCFVLPPNAEADQGVPSETVLSELCYQYRYDQKLQQVAKKIPGTEWVYIVYNKSGSVAATQDGKQRTRNEWLITKYDGQGRAVITGLWNNGNTAITGAALQSLIYQSPQWEKRDNGLANGYSSVSYPFVLNSVLTINYYDDYDFPGLPAVFNRQSTYSKMTRGLLTASRTAVLNNLSHQLWTVNYYDDESRVVELFKQHYLGRNLNEGNYDELTNTFNYTGQLTASQRKHFSGSSLALTTVNSFEYDHAGRKTHSYEQVNSGKNVLLSQVGYNELGQQKDKKLHSVDSGGSFAYDRIGYGYNERGWLTEMKSPMFDQVLRYNNPLKPGSVAQFNGNISEQEYRALQSGSQWVAYKYDPLNRLVSGSSSEGFTENGIGYDKAGNLTSMTRNNYGTLNYTYQNGGKSNRLLSVSGFRSGSYAYDLNGNTTSDQTRGVSIGYNLLNLPQDISGSQVITYTYDADGRKLRKVSGNTVTDYIDGIQYDNGQLAFIQTEEGRIIKSGTSYNYEYTVSDHLGNNRVTFDTSNGVANKVGEVSYYPFGYSVQRQLNAGNKYLYNGKELQEELGQYDYGARFYDPVIGRFNVIDRFSEKYYGLTPYQYGANNPVLNIDVNGDSIKVNTTVSVDLSVVGMGNINISAMVHFQGGSAYYQNGTAYNGSDNFVQQVGAALNDLNKGSAGKSLVSDLENSKKNTTTILNDTRGQGNLAANDGSQVRWNPNGNTGGPQEGTSSLTRPSFLGLGHELAHIQDIWGGTIDRGNWFQSGTNANGSPRYVQNAEKYATHVENQLRAERGLPLRTHYSPDASGHPYEPSRVIAPQSNMSMFYFQPNPISIIQPFKYK